MSLLLRSLIILITIATAIFLPLKTAAVSGAGPNSFLKLTGNIGSAGWYTSTVAVDIRAEDLSSGIKSITYQLDSNSPQTNTFTTGTNLLPNPSFESGSVDGWTTSGGAVFSQDCTTAQFDSCSVKVVNSVTGYRFWQTISGVSLTAGKTYTFSAWVKYSGVTGAGVKLVLDSASSNPVTGSSDWTRVYLNYQPVTSGSFTPEIGVDGVGTVNIDGAALYEGSFPAEVGFVVSTQGSHNLTYYSTNNNNVNEGQHSSSFNIDTTGPSGWRNLSVSNEGNDHTFEFSITVDDPISGLNTATGQYQYSLDGGTTWGYHTNLTQCNSNWVSNGWVPTEQSPGNSGTKTTTMETNATDFCDSNFAGCSKKVRFQIKDLAGNTSSKDSCLNSAWFQGLGGDLHSVGDISPASPSTVSYLASSQGMITNFTSDAGWLFPQYNLKWNLSDLYSTWRSQHYAGAAALPGGKLPGTGTGFYKVTTNFTIDNGTLPTGVSSADVNAVIFIDGNLSVDDDFTMKATSSYVFVVSGDVLVDGNVQNMAGFYLSQGKFDDHNGGPSNKQLIVSGAAWAIGNYSLERDLGKPGNTGTPADQFVLPAGTFLNSGLRMLLAGEVYILWQEIAP